MANPLNPVCVDYETAILLPGGKTQASVEYYREDFRAISCAFTECRNGELFSWFAIGESKIKEELRKLQGRPLIAHNVSFELGVSLCRFPDLKLDWSVDTMRLVQNYDNGGNDDAFERVILEPTDPDEEPEEEINYIGGFSLVNSCRRILQIEDHKAEAYRWLLENIDGVKKRNAGQFLDHLPEDILERYNIGDTENTFKLYEYLIEFFGRAKFNWQFDHGFYLSTLRHIVKAKIRGVLCDRKQILEKAKAVAGEIEEIEATFKARFKEEVERLERRRLLEEIRKRKTFRGKKRYLRRVKDNVAVKRKDVDFNVGSNKQLQMLFVDELKMQAKFFTAKGSPAFKASMLSQWGAGGEMLDKRRKRLLVLKQLANLYKLSEYDGRWHLSLKLAGTATGRFAGGNQ